MAPFGGDGPIVTVSSLAKNGYWQRIYDDSDDMTIISPSTHMRAYSCPRILFYIRMRVIAHMRVYHRHYRHYRHDPFTGIHSNPVTIQ